MIVRSAFSVSSALCAAAAAVVLVPNILLLSRTRPIHVAEASWATEIGVENSRVCFIVRTPKNASEAVISGTYDILDDDSDFPVSVSVHKLLFGEEMEGRDPEDHYETLWVSDEEEMEGKIHVEVEGGRRYTLCIENAFMEDDFPEDMPETRLIGFDIHVMTNPYRGIPSAVEGPDSEVTAHLMNSSFTLLESLDAMLDHQSYLKFREEAHEYAADRVFQKMFLWSIGEGLLLTSVATAQIFYLRNFFEQRRFL